jgi:sec-independent protein translocase protein TatC
MSTTPTETEHYDEKRMELTEHLTELRSRIMRALLYLTIGATACYFLFKPIYSLLYFPMEVALKASGVDVRIMFTRFTQPFFVVLQISVVAGLIVMSPLVTMELWGFVAPALTPSERKPLRYVSPLSVVLFVAGVCLGYWVARYAMYWFLGYVRWFPKGTVLYQDPQQLVLFMVKLMGAFGLVFQLPVILMFLAWVGILTSAGMKKSWRHAIVGISFVGMLVTPSNDVFTMLVMIIPVIVLYVASIGLVQLVEKKRAKRLAAL